MIRCFCLITCLLLTKVAGQVKLSIDLCRTNIKQEDCSRTMRIDEMGTYPFTQREERLYFKISA
uniref:Uncharacterized protein n=1 Tax=Plectus sambesii TaxID=2011161 RepID=A0A914VFN3_9BILA